MRITSWRGTAVLGTLLFLILAAAPLAHAQTAVVSLGRSVPGSSYTPGTTVNITVTLSRTGTGNITELGMEETLPAGWTYAGLAGGSTPNIAPANGAGGTLGFAWLSPPAMPFSFTYRASVPAGQSGDKTISGRALYGVNAGLQQQGPTANTTLAGPLPEGEGEGLPEGEGAPEGEGEGTVEGTVSLSQQLLSSGYTPGGQVDVQCTFDYDGTAPVLTLALDQLAPEGWTFGGVVSGTAPPIVPAAGDGGPFQFAYILVPTFPSTFVFRLTAPLDATGPQEIRGQGRYRFIGGDILTNEEVLSIPQLPGGGEGEGSPDGEGAADGEGEGEGQPGGGVTITRRIVGGATSYIAGGTLQFEVRFAYSGAGPVTALGLEESLPAGWQFQSVSGATPPGVLPPVGASGDIEFAYIFVPSFPFSFTYSVKIPPSARGTQAVSGRAQYFEDGPPLFSNTAQTTLAQAPLGNLAAVEVTVPNTLWIGQPTSLRFAGRNTGVSSLLAPWSDCFYLSTDQTYQVSDTLLGCAVRTEALASGAQYLGVASPVVAGVAPGQYFVLVRADVDNTTAETDDTDNFALAGPVTVAPITYAAIVSSNIGAGPSGSLVTLSGQADQLGGGGAAANVPVAVDVSLRDVTQRFQVTTGPDGRFSLPLQTLPTQAGVHRISARHPGLPSVPVQSTFTLSGLAAAPSQVAVELAPGFEQTVEIAVTNLGDNPLNLLAASVEGAPANVDVEVTAPAMLAASGTASLNITLLAQDDRVPAGQITVRYGNEDATAAIIVVDFAVLETVPVLEFDRPNLSVAAAPGDDATYTFFLRNTGGAPAEELEIVLPDLPWLALLAPRPPITLLPGERVPVVVQAAPATGQAPGQLSEQLALRTPDGEQTVPLALNVRSAAVGELQVILLDPLQPNAPGNPAIVDATIEARSVNTGAFVASATANEEGIAQFSGLVAGRYNLFIRSASHAAHVAPVDIESGASARLEVTLTRNLSRQEWVLTPGTSGAPDVFVPSTTIIGAAEAAIIVVDPPVLDLRESPAKETTVVLNIANAGTRAAEGVRLLLPAHPRFKAAALVNELGTIAPGESVDVPVVITDLAFGGSAAGPADCNLDAAAGAAYFFTVDSVRFDRFTPIARTFPATVCSAPAPLYGPLPQELDGRPIYANPPVFTGSVACDEDPAAGDGEGVAEGEGSAEGQAEGQGEGTAETIITFARSVVSGNPYAPGGLVDLQVTFTKVGGERITALGATEICPDGFSFVSVVGGSVPPLQPAPGATGALDFGYISPPGTFPASFTYRIQAGVTTSGARTVNGAAFFATSGTLTQSNNAFTDLNTSKRAGAAVAISPILPAVVGAAHPHGAVLAPRTGGAGAAKALVPCSVFRFGTPAAAVLSNEALSIEFLIANSAPSAAIQGFGLQPRISDGLGTTAAGFTLGTPGLSGLSGVGGSGTLAAGAGGGAIWPTTLSAGVAPGVYAVRGQLQYTQASASVDVVLPPDYFFVKPAPAVTTTYFVPAALYGDDSRTVDAEQPDVFQLGVLWRNTGAGPAENAAAFAAKPTARELDNNTVEPLNLLAAQANFEAAEPRFTVPLGDVPAGGAAAAVWTLASPLPGTLETFAPGAAYNNGAGQQRLFLTTQAATRDLVRVVRMDQPDDGVPDFLVNDTPDNTRLADRLYASTGAVIDLGVPNAPAFGAGTDGNRQFVLQANMPAGWAYLRVNNPAPSGFTLREVRRGDGSVVPVENSWITTRSERDAQGQPRLRNFFHLLDFNGSAQYTVFFDSNLPPNALPIADAGSDDAAVLGVAYTLNGANSFDPEGEPLNFAWSFVRRPTGSTASLVNPQSVTPQFTPDRTGNYVVSLVVNDGFRDSVPDTVTISTDNSAPSANAGPDQTRSVGSVVTLSGAASSDPDGQPLQYSWQLITRPGGSRAALSSATVVSPTFTIDVPGEYVALLVVSDGFLSSSADSVRVSTVNSAPIADAGTDISGAVGNTVTLDGRASRDVDGDTLTFTWSLTTRPAGSTAQLQNPTAVRPTLTIDRAGNYVARLTVSDGTTVSAPDTVTISTQNTAPIARTGNSRTAQVGEVVTLDGSASSDPDNQPLTYQWTLTTRPAGSAAVLSSTTAVRPSFLVDEAGTYVATLRVSDGVATSAPASVTISTINSPPVANAGNDQTIAVGAVATLDGGDSFDVDANELTFVWSFVSRPSGSTATLDNVSAVQPRFTVDRAGEYILQLVVRDDLSDSTPDTVVISTSNSAPVARAGADQSRPIGTTVNLDGSASSDVDNNPLTYRWTLTARPAGSAASLTAALSARPSFTIDVAGLYVAQLVVNDGLIDSAADTVLISTLNTAPVANAGADRSAQLGQTVQLNGGASSDVDQNPLSYRWSFTSRPAASTAVLSAANTVTPSFVVDAPGVYVAQLIVNDGTEDSAPDTVTVSTGDSAPIAIAGPDQSARIGAVVQLDGTGSSDPDGDPLSFSWSFSARPAGSAAALSSATSSRPTFTLDVAGDYTVQLIVTANGRASAPDVVTITTANTAPVANAGPAQSRLLGQSVQLDGTGSSDADGDTLSYAWSFTARPSGSTATLSNASSATPTFVVDRTGTFSVQLIVNDGTTDSAPSTVNISTQGSPPVARAGADQSVAVGELVRLNGGTSSDPDGQPLTYRWTFAARPLGSTAALANSTSATPSFTPDVGGVYTAQLVVNDGGTDSAPDNVSITATAEPVCTPPAAPSGVSASDGTFTDRVEVTWSTVSGATEYRVLRADSNNAANATAISGWITNTLFNDTSALPPQQVGPARGCGGTPPTQAVTYFYFVVARNAPGCEGVPSPGDAGTRGTSSGGKAFAALAEAAAPEPLFIAAMPDRALGTGERLAATNEVLAIRLHSAAADIALDSVRGTVRSAYRNSDTIAWVGMPDNPVRDGWAVYAPAAPFMLGEVVLFEVEATTVTGETLGPIYFTFYVDLPPQAAEVAMRESGAALPALAGATGPVYELGPRTPFAAPAAVWLPVPAGVRADALAPYIFADDGTTAAWYPAARVAGWLQESPRVVYDGGQAWIAFEAAHGATVVLGPAADAPAPQASSVVALGQFSNLLLVVAVAATLVIAGRRRKEAR